MSKKKQEEKLVKRLFTNLHYKYKLVIMNESTFEERLSFRLSRINVLFAYVLLSLVSIAFTLFIIYITPLKEYIPGYASVEQVQQVYINRSKIDSLEIQKMQGDMYLENFKKRILMGEDLEGADTLVGQVKEGMDYANIPDHKSPHDSLLRDEWEEKENYDLVYYPSQKNYNGISRFVFFTPVHGKVINGFDSKNRHYGVDILGKKDMPVNATLEGTVIMAAWTFEGGYVISIQHDDELISVYKHNSILLKAQGDRVNSGDPIAIIGNTGKQSTGPHLHFELWYHRNPVNPSEFINFD